MESSLIRSNDLKQLYLYRRQFQYHHHYRRCRCKQHRHRHHHYICDKRNPLREEVFEVNERAWQRTPAYVSFFDLLLCLCVCMCVM